MIFDYVFEKMPDSLNISNIITDSSVVLYHLPFLEELYECHVQALAGMKS